MALFIVPTPFGHPEDVTLRAISTLKRVNLVLIEERKESLKNLRSFGVNPQHWEIYNEHTSREQVYDWAKLCLSSEVALVSDGGTPNLFDPGHCLVKEVRRLGGEVKALPGASSLSLILSLSSQPLHSFMVLGFLPRDSHDRQKLWKFIQKSPYALVIYDTPYRLQKVLEELMTYVPEREVLLGIELTTPEEIVLEGQAAKLPTKILPKKGEFVLLLYQPRKSASIDRI